MSKAAGTPRTRTSRTKDAPTPTRPPSAAATAVRAAAAGARPVEPPVPDPVTLDDGTEVVFSFSHWLKSKGLDDDKPVEAGGRVWQFRTTGTTEENSKLFAAMATGQYVDALRIMLVDGDQAEELVACLRVPFASKDEQRMWREFVEAVSGVTLGNSSAS